jgi:hypothetical protein
VATELAVDTADAVLVYFFRAGCLLVGNCSGVGPIDGSRSECPLRIRKWERSVRGGNVIREMLPVCCSCFVWLAGGVKCQETARERLMPKLYIQISLLPW